MPRLWEVFMESNWLGGPGLIKNLVLRLCSRGQSLWVAKDSLVKTGAEVEGTVTLQDALLLFYQSGKTFLYWNFVDTPIHVWPNTDVPYKVKTCSASATFLLCFTFVHIFSISGGAARDFTLASLTVHWQHLLFGALLCLILQKNCHVSGEVACGLLYVIPSSNSSLSFLSCI